jgi:hypothetical protein
MATVIPQRLFYAARGAVYITLGNVMRDLHAPPPLVGRVLEGLRHQGFICEGELVPGARLLYFGLNGEWWRLVLDWGTVHWYLESAEPKSWSVPAEGWEYPVCDLEEGTELIGARITNYLFEGGDRKSFAEFHFDNGKKLRFDGDGDTNSYSVA